MRRDFMFPPERADKNIKAVSSHNLNNGKFACDVFLMLISNEYSILISVCRQNTPYYILLPIG